MGLFDRLKKALRSEAVGSQEPAQPSIERNGSEKGIEQRNREYQVQRNKEITTLTQKYDFDTIDGINSIPVPAPPINKGSTTGQIDYYLRLRASEYKRQGKMDLAIACLQKANALMPHSSILWQGKDYLKLVQYLKAAKRFDEARSVESDLKKRFPESFDDGTLLSKKHFQAALQQAKNMKTDLLEMSSHATCGECAKYQGRVYSISGQDKRYPVLPDFFKKYGGVHPGCRHTFYPYFHGSTTANRENAVEFSNRPFIDDRSPTEIAAYEQCLNERRAKEQIDADRIIYDTLCEKLPELAPKSFGGYRKMKSANSSAFQRLKESAQSIGVEI